MVSPAFHAPNSQPHGQPYSQLCVRRTAAVPIAAVARAARTADACHAIPTGSVRTAAACARSRARYKGFDTISIWSISAPSHACLSALKASPRQSCRVVCSILRAHADRVLICSWNPMLWPIWGPLQGRRIQSGSMTGEGCRCLNDHCHFCTRTVGGDTCRVVSEGPPPALPHTSQRASAGISCARCITHTIGSILPLSSGRTSRGNRYQH